MKKETFKKLFDTYFDEVRRFIFYKSGNEELATDLAQDVFMKLWEKDFNIDESRVKGLLFKIANDLFITSYRKEKVAFKFFDTYQVAEKVLTPQDHLNYSELKTTYQKALQTMPEKQRIVFLMSRIDENKYNEIAELLHISVKAVENRMSLALKHLRKHLKSNQA